MKRKLFRLCSLALAIFIVATCFTSCKNDPEPETTTLASTTAAQTTLGETAAPGTGDTTVSNTAETSSVSGTVAGASTGTATTAPTVNTTAPPAGESKTPSEILAIYTEVLTKAKNEKPAHKKYEYQEIPGDEANRVFYEGKSYSSALLGLVDSLDLITPKEEAMGNPEVKDKGNDMRWFPMYKTTVACALSDAGKIKEAKYEPQSDGNVKLTIVLNDEENAQPMAENATTSPSATGGMFAPLDLSEVDSTLTGNALVTALIKDVKYNLLYHDCTATLVFNPATKQIVSLEQIMVVKITGSAKAMVLFPVNLMQQLYNTTKWFDFTY